MDETVFMVMETTMIHVNQDKTHLSRYARRIRQGERFILCDRNKPFAEIRPLPTDSSGRRPFGQARGRIHVPDDFNDPVPAMEDLFAGRD
jgi:antitoxin (DNA-binding transcriptional repressor) of toxin-antitoxin stability system